MDVVPHSSYTENRQILPSHCTVDSNTAINRIVWYKIRLLPSEIHKNATLFRQVRIKKTQKFQFDRKVVAQVETIALTAVQSRRLRRRHLCSLAVIQTHRRTHLMLHLFLLQEDRNPYSTK